MEPFLSVLLNLVLLYLVLGILFSIVFLARGLSKVDEAAQGSSLWFKLILIPGMLVFWPLFLRKWLTLKK